MAFHEKAGRSRSPLVHNCTTLYAISFWAATIVVMSTAQTWDPTSYAR